MVHPRINFLCLNKFNLNKKTYFKNKYTVYNNKEFNFFYKNGVFCNYINHSFKIKNHTKKTINTFSIISENKIETVFFF